MAAVFLGIIAGASAGRFPHPSTANGYAVAAAGSAMRFACTDDALTYVEESGGRAMARMDSGRRPGLGEAFLSVYGITRGMCETGISKNRPETPHGFIGRVANALRKRLRHAPDRLS